MRFQLHSLGDVWSNEFAGAVDVAEQLAAVGARAGLALEDRRMSKVDHRIELSLRHVRRGIRILLALTGEREPESTTPLRAGLCQYRVDCMTLPDTAESTARTEDIVRQFKVVLGGFSASELQRIAKVNPLVTRAADRYRGIDWRRTSVVICEHPLLEKLNLIRALLEIGMPPEHCVFVAKRDRTQYRRQVREAIEMLGVRVVSAGACDINDALPSVVSEQLIVVDDGGSVIRALAGSARIDGAQLVPIETTTKGIRVLREEFPELELVDLAACSIKRDLAQEIAVSCVLRFRALLQHESVSREPCVVVGYGQLGSHVANMLATLGTPVSVVEINPAQRALSRARGHSTYASLNSALRAAPHRYLFGCSGVPSVSLSDLQLMLPDRVLATVSSQDLSLLPASMDQKFAHSKQVGLGDVYVDEDGQKTTILAHGDAVNLYLSEGVSEPEFDRFTALMLVALGEVARTATTPVPVRSFDVEAWCAFVEGLRRTQQPSLHVRRDFVQMKLDDVADDTAGRSEAQQS